MAVAVRVALCTFAILTFSGLTKGQPFFDEVWCGLFCVDYDDDSDSSSSGMEETIYSMLDPCKICGNKAVKDTTPTVSPTAESKSPFNIEIPPSPVGVDLSLQNKDGRWFFNFSPWMPSTTVAATTAAAAATTAAPTTAASATTAAATTKAP